MIKNLEIKITEYNSPLQRKSILLRYQILRKPLGLIFNDDDLKTESEQIHIVATFEDNVYGVLLLQQKNTETIKMRQVAVDATFQNKQIGSQMVHFAEIYAKKNGYCTIELHARISSINFYKKLSYNTVGNEFLEVNIPHIKMYKNLN